MLKKKVLYKLYFVRHSVYTVRKTEGDNFMRQKLFISLDMAKLIFMSGLISLFVSLYATEKVFPRKIYLMDINLSGYQHFSGQELSGRIKTGDVLFLKQENTGFDIDNNIEIYTRDGEHLGFIPVQSHLPTVLLEQNIRLQAIVKNVLEDEDTIDRMKISIFQVL